MEKTPIVYCSMYTYRGDKLVNKYVIDPALKNKWTWKQTYDALRALSEKFPKTCGETMDTAVREEVFYALGYHTTNENFYV